MNRMSAVLKQNLYKPIAIVGALAFVYFTVLTKLGRDWWNDENYSHGLLIPFVIAFILWQERKRILEAQPQPALGWGAIGVGLSLLTLWAGTAGAELFVQRISLVVMLASVVIYFLGFRLLRPVAVPLLLLVLSIPIPQIVFNKIAFPLQLFASSCAVSVMRLFDISVLRQGNVIELMPLGAREPKRLAVVEACSGIRSLMTLVTLAVVYAYFTTPNRRPTNFSLSQTSAGDSLDKDDKLKFVGHSSLSFAIRRALILVIAAVPIAILTNAVRVSGTGVLAHYYGTKVADGFFHSFSGWAIYIAAALLLFATAWILDRLAGDGKRGSPNLSALRVSVVESTVTK
jgi:exosortase